MLSYIFTNIFTIKNVQIYKNIKNVKRDKFFLNETNVFLYPCTIQFSECRTFCRRTSAPGSGSSPKKYQKW